MVEHATFEIKVDGRTAVVERESGTVRVLDSRGREVSREQIQVAAGSVQGLFSALEAAAGPNPLTRA